MSKAARAFTLTVADGVYNWANRFVDQSPWSHPYYLIATAAAAIADRLDPIPPRGVSGS